MANITSQLSHRDPLVSLIIPTRNRPETVLRTLVSIRDASDVNTNQSCEIIILDNDSHDPEGHLNRATQVSPNVSLIRNGANLGLHGSLLKAFELARGEFVFLSSDEDVPDLVALERLLKSECSLALSSFVVNVCRNGERYGRYLSSRELAPKDFHRGVHYMSGVGIRTSSVVPFLSYLYQIEDNEFLRIYPHIALLLVSSSQGGRCRFWSDMVVRSGEQSNTSEIRGQFDYKGPQARVSHAVGLSDLLAHLSQEILVNPSVRKDWDEFERLYWRNMPNLLAHDGGMLSSKALQGLTEALSIRRAMLRLVGRNVVRIRSAKPCRALLLTLGKSLR